MMKNYKPAFAASFLLLLSVMLGAQSVPAPASAQKGHILIMNATAHLGNGSVIENSVIAFENGKITLVGDARLVRLDMGIYTEVIEAAGKHVYPGFIATNATVGLQEIGAVRATRDQQEIGKYNPNVRAAIAYNTDSKIIPTLRSNGVLMAQICPRGEVITGT